MYQHILYPTDGSAGSKAAVDHVRELASAFDATVHVLHVIDARHGGLGMSGAFLADDDQAMSAPNAETGYLHMEGDLEETDEVLARASDRIAEEANEEFGDIETETAVEIGTPHSVILEHVDEHDIDLVVMGTHGRTGVERYLLGSVTEKVVRMSDAPVVTVRADENE